MWEPLFIYMGVWSNMIDYGVGHCVCRFVCQGLKWVASTTGSIGTAKTTRNDRNERNVRNFVPRTYKEILMNRITKTIAALGLFAVSALTFAQQDEYETVPKGDPQYLQCLSRVNKLYEGGSEPSPIRGQNKAQAYCTCLWNETPDDFRGDLSKFADSAAGASLDRICVKYSRWE
jgi:hypothetical protein